MEARPYSKESTIEKLKKHDFSNLIQRFNDSNTEDIQIHPNSADILEELKQDSRLSFLTQRDVKLFEQSLYNLSRSKEFHQLRGKKRYLSSRPWISFAPGNVLACDLSFIRPIQSIKRTEITKATRPTIVLVLIDIFR